MEINEAPNAFEAAVDSWLADAYQTRAEIAQQMDLVGNSLKRDAGATFYYRHKQRVTDMTTDEAIEICTTKLANGEFKPWDVEGIALNLKRIADWRESFASLTKEILNLEDLYTGWNRFFIVNNTGGHIHSSMSCHSCRITTQFGWLPDQSGLTEKDAVEAHGPHLCTFCFPSAPVEWTFGIGQDKPKAEQCEGSGKSANIKRYGQRYCECDTCGQSISVTSRGLLRTHKPKGA